MIEQDEFWDRDHIQYRLSSQAERWLLLDRLNESGALGPKQVEEMRELKEWLKIDL